MSADKSVIKVSKARISPNDGRLQTVLALPGVAPTGAMILVVAIWAASVKIFDIPKFLLPSPLAVLDAALNNASLLWDNSKVTVLETVIGFFLSAVIGMLIALVMLIWPLLGKALFPIVVASQVIPKVAVAPLMVVWLGTGVTTSSLIAFIMAFFPVVVNATLGLNSVDEGSLQLLRSMRASKWQEFRYLRLPAALPSIMGGLQLAVAFAIVGAIVGEFVGSNSGLGYLLIVTQGNIRTDLLFATLGILTIIGLVLYYSVEMLAKFVLRKR